MAIGLHRPHTPLVVPQKYFDMFPLKTIQTINLKEEDYSDTYLENNNLNKGGMSRGRKACVGLVKGMNQRRLALKKYTQAYLASVAFADDRVGELAEALENSRVCQQYPLLFSLVIMDTI